MPNPATPTSDSPATNFLAAQTTTTIETSGGAVIQGKVNTGGGDFIGRDKVIGYTAEQVSVLITEIKSGFQPKLFDGKCPYVGLVAFEEEDKDRFFGRETLVQVLVERVKQARFVVIAGPSGSGKSSVVRAGLIPQLRNGALPESEHWLYETLKPGRNPLNELGRVVASLTSKLEAGDDIRNKGMGDPALLHRWLEVALKGQRNRRAILLVDQFEELFTQVADEAERLAFLNLLIHAATVEEGQAIILFTLRSDFIANCALYPPLNSLLNQQFIQVGPLLGSELVSAIARPALQVGLRIDPDLVAQVANEMDNQPGALPLMQFALKDLFDAQQAKGGIIALSRDDYLARGGIGQALQRHADERLGQLTADEQRLARSIFSGLIQVGRGALDTRRTATVEELTPAGSDAAQMHKVIDKLAQARLITTDERGDKNIATLAHERLIEAWPWLQRLVNENREAIALQNQINEDATRWDHQQQNASYLYTGARLATAQEQLAEQKLILSGLAEVFVKAGIEAQEKKDRAEEEARQREEQNQRNLAAQSAKIQAEQRRATILRRFAYGLAALALVAAVATVVALSQRREADNQRQIAVTEQGKAVQQAEIAVTEQAKAVQQAEIAGTEQAKAEIARNEADQNASAAATAEAFAKTEQGKAKQQAEIAATEQAKAEIARNEADQNASAAATAEAVAKAAQQETDRLKDQIRADQIAQKASLANVDTSVTQYPQRALLLAIEAVKIVSPPVSSSLTTLHELLARTGGVGLGEHDSNVLRVAFSPDGQTLASASADNTIRLWSLAQPQAEPVVLQGHEDSVWSVAFSPDGQTLASASADKTVRLWSLAQPQVDPVVLKGHDSFVLSVAFSPDGQTLASVSDDNTIHLWSLAQPQADPVVLTGHDYPVSSVAFSPDGQTLASDSYDNTILLWSLAQPQAEPVVLKGHEGFVTSVAFSSDGQTLASADYDGTIRLWSLTQPQAPVVLTGHDAAVNSVAFSPDGQTLASASADKTIRLWSLAQPQVALVVLKGHEGPVNSVAFSPDGQTLASASADNTIRLWPSAQPQADPVSMTGHEDSVTSVAFSPDGQTLASVSWDNTIRLWSLAQPQAAPFVLKGHDAAVWSVAFSPDGQTLASASDDNTIRLWSLAQPQAAPIVLTGHDSFVRSMAFSPDGQTLASASYDNTIRLWSLAQPQADPVVLTGHDSYVESVAFSPDGQTLASASYNGTIRLWSLAQPQAEPVVPTGHDYPVTSVAFSPDGQTLASASYDNTIRLWSLAQPHADPVVLIGHESTVTSVAFSPDGQTLASASWDKTIRLWSLAQPQAAPVVLIGHEDAVNSVAFSPDGQILASASWDNTIRLWSQSERLLALACRVAGRNLSSKEWQQYFADRAYQRTCPQWPAGKESNSD